MDWYDNKYFAIYIVSLHHRKCVPYISYHIMLVITRDLTVRNFYIYYDFFLNVKLYQKGLPNN